MKILVLHGHTQSGPFFERKTLRLQRHLQKSFPGMTFVFPTAPLRLNPSQLTDGRYGKALSQETDNKSISHTFESVDPDDDIEAYSWFKLHDTQEPAFGFNQSVDMLAEILEQQGPFEGVIGFSQGSALAGVVASLLEGPERKAAFDRHLAHFPDSMPYPESFKILNHPPLKFGITYGTFVGIGDVFSALYQDPLIQTPFCHFQGLYDPVVGTEMRQAAEARCIGGQNRYNLVHPGAHHVPMGLEYMEAVVNFMKSAGIEDRRTLYQGQPFISFNQDLLVRHRDRDIDSCSRLHPRTYPILNHSSDNDLTELIGSLQEIDDNLESPDSFSLYNSSSAVSVSTATSVTSSPLQRPTSPSKLTFEAM